ncbi:MAG: NAD(P)(+) transhydrogenase (Re/Si-specific) subunit beta [Holosporaceae bacterium]|jgi:NAD(P) transhydrogenase subunit beta|nr:NAD(P)(+) transhydrogenase (Re/Si-specific) subunit beta [Holosporaceae bacterium]
MENILYLIAAVCFIFALKGLSSAESAMHGNICGIAGMMIVGIATFMLTNHFNLVFIISIILVGGAAGICITNAISMAALPQLMAGFHSMVGMAAVLVAYAVFLTPEIFGMIAPFGLQRSSLGEMGIGATVGAMTFSGSLLAFLKLQGICRKFNIPPALNAFLGMAMSGLLMYFVLTDGNRNAFILGTACAFVLGITLILPIGGADMPIIVSILNSLSGWTASGIGFTLHNDLLIITGALVGASGAILSHIMCKSMNRQLWDVIFKTERKDLAERLRVSRSFKQGCPEDAAYLLRNAKTVIVIPGYGMATSQAQHALKEMEEILAKFGAQIKYAIHPVAGRMPGHMNVLLAEANVSYDKVFEMDEINREFPICDVAYVIGANDITNPAAKKDPESPVYGMPILDVEKAKVILFLKRSMGPGYAGIDNELFYAANTVMLLGDAKKTTEAIIKAML